MVYIMELHCLPSMLQLKRNCVLHSVVKDNATPLRLGALPESIEYKECTHAVLLWSCRVLVHEFGSLKRLATVLRTYEHDVSGHSATPQAF